MSSNFDPYQTPSTSLGAMSGGQAMSSFESTMTRMETIATAKTPRATRREGNKPE